MNKILKIGHRGAAGYEPENTLVSFQKAIEMGVDGIELDVHLSKDGQIMVIHDVTIDRTTNGKGMVNELSFTKLKKYGIPTLSQVLELVNRNCFVNIELKGNGTSKPVIEIIRSYVLEKKWKYNQFLISSFDWKMLEEVQTLNPKIRLGVLTEDSILEAIAFAKSKKAFSIHPNYLLLTKENAALMQENGFQVYPWTVNDIQEISRMKSFGVNGIISDFTDRI
ncbi:MAG: glycerophosphodiester phosphodiesterase [Flavobacterium sp.]|nr:glycerophosphodiester phosphodiesterase [Flavobacterium sp.]